MVKRKITQQILNNYIGISEDVLMDRITFERQRLETARGRSAKRLHGHQLSELLEVYKILFTRKVVI